MSTWAYLRVSSERQGRDTKASIPQQRADVARMAEADGYPIDVWLVDSEKFRSEKNRLVEPSGTRLDRPGFVRLLAGIKSGECTRFYVWALDRLGRGSSPLVTIRDALDGRSCDVRVVHGSWDAELAEIFGALSGLELPRMKRRFKMGRQDRHENKKLHHAAPPTGYSIVRDENGNSIGYELQQTWRAVLIGIAQRFLAGESYYRIAADVPSPHGPGKWPESWVETVVKNPFYRGNVRLNGKVVPGKHEAVFDEAMSRALDREIARRKAWLSSRPRRKKHINLFAGLLRCAHCGSWLKVNNQSIPRKSKLYHGYACAKRYKGHKGDHPSNSVLESVIIEQLRALLSHGDGTALLRLAAGEESPTQIDRRLESLRAELTEMEAGRAAVSGIPLAAKLLDADISRLRAEIESRSQPELIDVRGANEADLVTALEELRGVEWWTGDRAQAAQLLRGAFREIWVKAGRISLPPAV